MTTSAVEARPETAVTARQPLGMRALVGIWTVFALVHLVVALLGLKAPGQPLNDINLYSWWAQQYFTGDVKVGINQSWVYPILALVPMLVTRIIFGVEQYTQGWLALCILLNGLAMGVLLRSSFSRRLRIVAAYWWLIFLLLLGPVALGRIDSISAPIAVVALLWVFRRPRAAAALLTIGAWIKVWPAALLATIFVAIRRKRIEILVVAVSLSAGIIVIALLLGSGVNIFSFFTAQVQRNLQIEAPASFFFMFAMMLGARGISVEYNHQIFTVEIINPVASVVASALTPLMAVAFAALILLGWFAIRRGAAHERVLSSLAVGSVFAFLLFNKVGSPQFITWLAAPIILVILIRGKKVAWIAALGLIISASTQIIYPYWYWQFASAQPFWVFDFFLKTASPVAIFVWAIVDLVSALRSDRRDVGLLATDSGDGDGALSWIRRVVEGRPAPANSPVTAEAPRSPV